MEVAGLGLILQRSVAQACSHVDHCLGPAPMEVTSLLEPGPAAVLQRVLAQA